MREVNVTNIKCQSSDLNPGCWNQCTRKHTHTNLILIYIIDIWKMFYQEHETGTEHNVRDEQVLLKWKKAKYEGSRSDAKTSLAVHFINGLEETE